MGDVCDALDELLSPGGMDYDMLSEEEKKKSDASRLTYTDRDKKIMRHFEGAAEPARRLTKFLQETNDAWSYTTFELQLALADTASKYIPIYPDVSHMDHTKDLRNRGHKSVLVKKVGVVVPEDVLKNYDRVEVMDPLVGEYCKLYTKDLSERIGLDATYLPPDLTHPVLMNPMFGTKSYIVGSGLLTGAQYTRARSGMSMSCLCVMM